jgi:hypothetical protein
VPPPLVLVACWGYRPGLWFPQICLDVLVSEPVLRKQYDTLQVLHGLRGSGFACHSLDGFDTICQCMHHFVGMCDGGIGDLFVLELDRVDVNHPSI